MHIRLEARVPELRRRPPREDSPQIATHFERVLEAEPVAVLLSRGVGGERRARAARPKARSALGSGARATLMLNTAYAQALFADDGSSLEDLDEAEAVLKDSSRLARQVLGAAHPQTVTLVRMQELNEVARKNCAPGRWGTTYPPGR